MYKILIFMLSLSTAYAHAMENTEQARQSHLDPLQELRNAVSNTCTLSEANALAIITLQQASLLIEQTLNCAEKAIKIAPRSNTKKTYAQLRTQHEQFSARLLSLKRVSTATRTTFSAALHNKKTTPENLSRINNQMLRKENGILASIEALYETKKGLMNDTHELVAMSCATTEPVPGKETNPQKSAPRKITSKPLTLPEATKCTKCTARKPSTNA